MEPDKLSNSVRISITTLYDYLHKYDYETIKEYFDTVYGTDDNKKFDFEIGLLCGTIRNNNKKPVLEDLQFTNKHLPTGEQDDR